VRLVYNTHLLYYTVDLEDTLASCHVFASELTQQVDEIREFPQIGMGPHGSSETCFSGEVSLVVPQVGHYVADPGARHLTQSTL
jgi:hypothetical protein